MSFDNIGLLVAGLPLLIVCIAAYLWAERRKTTNDQAYSDIAFFAEAVRPRAWIPSALRAGWVLALCTLLIAAAGPHLELPVPIRDGAVFICIDTSGSMQSTDVIPTRAGAAAEAARAFIHESPAGVRIGLIAFSNGATLVQPLTADHDVALAAVDQIPPPNGATAIGDALQLAASEFPPTGHRVVILITDGVNNAGADPQSMAEQLGAHHIPVYTIGIGTQNGDVIGGEQSTIDEGALQGYAKASGGTYSRAQNAAQLRAALEHLGSQVSIVRQKTSAAVEFAFAGAGLLAVTLFAGLCLGRYP